MFSQSAHTGVFFFAYDFETRYSNPFLWITASISYIEISAHVCFLGRLQREETVPTKPGGGALEAEETLDQMHSTPDTCSWGCALGGAQAPESLHFCLPGDFKAQGCRVRSRPEEALLFAYGHEGD